MHHAESSDSEDLGDINFQTTALVRVQENKCVVELILSAICTGTLPSTGLKGTFHLNNGLDQLLNSWLQGVSPTLNLDSPRLLSRHAKAGQAGKLSKLKLFRKEQGHRMSEAVWTWVLDGFRKHGL